MKIAKLLSISLLGIVLLTGCANGNSVGTSSSSQAISQEQTPDAPHTSHAPNGDLQEITNSISTLPTFLDTVDPNIKAVYRIAADHNDLLQSIPCYCGCGESAGHQHNGNCFIKEVKEDGSVTWDDHGTRCKACMDIAITSAKMIQEGKTKLDIRTYIDENFSKGYADPTPTPMPTA
ncbi:PCYCGC domain-containing protein [Brevibacillus laterosporus]|uniref:PCYCGC domain-containing protein n=1 Tax=Brevibacillus halotolerans TaxID=1507437 RepID=A0ABT4I1Z0_9BACL|nr:PCYCGC domain-containing protein [Brevibacillus laterosporus]MCR8987342.1 PCYCGC domain-containing protein [Brevibacillus laterosporus]MCZ0833080.1 PCYCGC domain-containing protein [Brevibacillus halotolerans]